MLAFPVATLVAALVVPQDPPTPKPAATPAVAAELMQAARAKLKAIGYEVPATIEPVARTNREVIADLDHQQDVLFPQKAFELQHALLTALGKPMGKDGAALRRQTVAAMARGISAYYDVGTGRFVLLPTATRAVGEALAGSSLPLVVHELVHACQDARPVGLQKLFDAEHASFDSALVARMAIEGEAEVATVAALRGEAAVAELVDASIANTLDKLFAGELTGLLYQHGRRMAALRHAAGGLAAVQALTRRLPASCEQMLHAEKGADEPRPVVLPTFADTELVATSTLGELMTYFLLRTAGHDVKAAALASAGWDGDRLALVKSASGTCVVWRSVWDRDADATQFAALHAARHGVVVQVRGRCVDFVGGGDDATRQRLAAICAEAGGEWPEQTGDADSTQTVEAAIEADAAASAEQQGQWVLRDHELSIPIRDGFELREVQGMSMLVHQASVAQGFATNVNVQVAARGAIADAAGLLDVNRAQLQQMKTLTVVKAELGKVGAQEVVFTEFHGRIGAMAPIHCLQVLYLHGDNQVVVTATAAAKRWDEYAAALQALMAGITIGPK